MKLKLLLEIKKFLKTANPEFLKILNDSLLEFTEEERMQYYNKMLLSVIIESIHFFVRDSWTKAGETRAISVDDVKKLENMAAQVISKINS